VAQGIGSTGQSPTTPDQAASSEPGSGKEFTRCLFCKTKLKVGQKCRHAQRRSDVLVECTECENSNISAEKYAHDNHKKMCLIECIRCPQGNVLETDGRLCEHAKRERNSITCSECKETFRPAATYRYKPHKQKCGLQRLAVAHGVPCIHHTAQHLADARGMAHAKPASTLLPAPVRT
jgi:hypothetical protein